MCGFDEKLKKKQDISEGGHFHIKKYKCFRCCLGNAHHNAKGLFRALHSGMLMAVLWVGGVPMSVSTLTPPVLSLQLPKNDMILVKLSIWIIRKPICTEECSHKSLVIMLLFVWGPHQFVLRAYLGSALRISPGGAQRTKCGAGNTLPIVLYRASPFLIFPFLLF